MEKWIHFTDKHPTKNDTYCKVMLLDGTVVENVWYVTDYSMHYNWLVYELDKNGKRIDAKMVENSYEGNPVVYWQELPRPSTEIPSDYNKEEIQSMNEFHQLLRGDQSLRTGVTDPCIDVDFYKWRRNMSDRDKAFLDLYSISATNKNDLLMFAWRASRIELRLKAENNESQY